MSDWECDYCGAGPDAKTHIWDTLEALERGDDPDHVACGECQVMSENGGTSV